MTVQPTKSPIGLDGVPAAETALSHVDGQKGELVIVGERIADLVAKTSFEGITARLWTSATDVPVSEAEVRAALGEARVRAYSRLSQLMAASEGLSVVDGFRAAAATLRAEHGLT